MASLWCSFMEAVTLGYDQAGQGGSRHHNHMVDGHPLSHEPAGELCQGAHSQSSSDHRGVPGDPNVTWRKLFTKVRVEESESEDEEEFKDSRKTLPPRDLVEPSSTHEQVLLPANVIASSQPSSSSLGPTSQLGVSQDIVGRDVVRRL